MPRISPVLNLLDALNMNENDLEHTEAGKPRLLLPPNSYIPKLTSALQLWDTETPAPPHHFAAHSECQNAALFQMIQAALSAEKAEGGLILINPSPKTRKAAEANLFSFSDEQRAHNATLEVADTNRLEQITQAPRLRKCYGWMRFTGQELFNRLPWGLSPARIEIYKVKRTVDAQSTYIAFVYEFIEAGPSPSDKIQEALDFFWKTGFSYVPIMRQNNSENGILLDHSEIVHSNGAGWNANFFWTRPAKFSLWYPVPSILFANTVLQLLDCNGT
ncbi:hypothetical protein HJFPF1_07276 [Paramyrothecium foliicola]|nr:hypothetical protein HJFPF1_07276 [Paramyrothecium foliicola]